MLALTGPTGVGKSETAFRIAEGALAKRRRVGKSFKYLPDGLLTLRGEDYARGDIEEVCYHLKNRHSITVPHIFSILSRRID